MSSEHMIKFEMEDVLKAIRKLDEVRSSNDDMERLPKSPVHALVYNQILQCSIEELEAPVKDGNWPISFADVVFRHRHALYFTACIRRGAFRNILSEETKLLLDNVTNPSNSLFESIHMIERGRMGKGTDKAETLNFSTFMGILMERYLHSFKDEERKQVMDLIIDKFAVKESQFITQYLVHHMPRFHSEAYEYIGKKIKELNIDLSTISLNSHLPKEKEEYKNLS